MVKKNICEISIIIIIILICQKLGSVGRIKQSNKLPSALELFLPVFVKFRPNQRYTHLFIHFCSILMRNAFIIYHVLFLEQCNVH